MSITFCQLHNFWEVGRGTGGSGNGCAVTSKISRKSRLEGCNLESQKSASALRDRWMGWEGDLKANQNQSQWNGLECDTKLCFKQMERRCDENNASLVREPGEPLLGQPFKGLGKRREVRSVPGQLTMMMKMFNHNGDDDGEMENYLELKSQHHHHHHHHHHHDKCIWITLGWRANTEQGCLSPPCSPVQSEMKKMVNCLKYQRRCWWECSMDDNDGQIWWNLPAGLQGLVGSLFPP